MIRYLTVFFLLTVPTTAEENFKSWQVYHGGPGNLQYSALSQINRDNVDRLRIAWIYDSRDAFNEDNRQSELQSNPIIIGRRLYTVTPKGRVVALDAANGKELWRFLPVDEKQVLTKVRLRGLTYWTDGKQSRILFTSRHFLYTLDAATGLPVKTFGENGRVDMRQGFHRPANGLMIGASSPGILYQDLIIMGSTGYAPGDIRAFNVRTGEIEWRFHTIPHPGEFGHDSWPENAWKTMNGANNWAGMALDETRGIVFVPTASGGAFDKDFYGADRSGDNLFANSLIALDARTGKRLWHFQTVRHDLWDRDLPAPPTLVTVKRNGKTIDAVAQVTKSGFIFVFDRENGTPLFPIEEYAAPASDIPGETAATHQPVPVKPAPFAPQEVTRETLTTRTPEAHRAVLETFEKLKSKGRFIPPSLQGSIIFPGLDGGAEWGGSAFDPESGLLYVNANIMPWILKLRKRPDVGGEINGRTLYLENCSSCHGENLEGSPPEFPSLANIGDAMNAHDILFLIKSGLGRMPSFSTLPREYQYAIADFVANGTVADIGEKQETGIDAFWTEDYIFDGYRKFLDPDGYPAIQPPWGTLSAINLDSGEYAWQVPLGEYPELVTQGITGTGSENYGGPVVTAGGLLFIGATLYDRKFRVFDKKTGDVLWETILPTAANATPAVYEVDGKQFVVISVGGGKTSRFPADSKLIAFSLPE